MAEQSGPGAGGEQAPPTRDGERTGGRDEGKSEGASGAGNNAASDGGGSASDKASNAENDGAGQGKEKETENIPILILTSRNQIKDIEIGLEMGAEAYLVKPLNTTELLRTIKVIESSQG
ncbi:MAG: hypothetical protein IIC06_03065 [Proteobacteria bacterium]|nr:hypothetical protein [Pseudomonadota bacterium]